jgi:AraC-like DNA-binding protein
VLREVYGRTILKHDFEPIGDGPLRFEASLLTEAGLGFASGSISPVHARRRSEHINSDDFILNVILSGGRTVHQLGREALLREGEAVLMTCAEPGGVTQISDNCFYSLRVPRAILETNVADIDACLIQPIPRENRALQLLTSYVAGMRLADASARNEWHEHVVAHVHDLLWTTLGATRDAGELANMRGIRAARLLAIKRDIVEHANLPRLSIRAIASRHGITPRYVHKLFEAEGITFSAFLLERRLARAYEMLSDPHHLRSKISTIASQCGFQDLSWFNRVFRRRYDAAPSDIRETALRRFR